MPKKSFNYKAELLNIEDEPGRSTSSQFDEHSISIREQNATESTTMVPLPRLPANDVNLRKIQKDTCCCPAGFFTTRFTMLNTVAFLIVVSILVLTLNLEVNDAETAARDKPYVTLHEVNSFNESEEEVFFILHGTPTYYPKFGLIAYSDRADIKSLDLTYVDIDINMFMKNLDGGNWGKLESIILKNVRFEGIMPWSSKWRPKVPVTLKNFYLEYNDTIGPGSKFNLELCDICYGGWGNPFREFVDPTCLEYLLFFDSRFHETKNFTDLEFNISIKIWGLTYIHLNFDTGELISSLKYTDKILQDINNGKKQLKKFSLRDANLDLETMASLPVDLEELHLDNVYLDHHLIQVKPKIQQNETKFSVVLNSVSISKALSRFTKLRQLTLKFGDLGGSTEAPQSVIRNHINLDDIPRTIKNLTLQGLKLTMNTNSTVNFHLDRLCLKNVDVMNMNIIMNFSQHFSVNEVYWEVAKAKPPRYFINWRPILLGVLKSNPNLIFLDNSKVGLFRDTMTLNYNEIHPLINYFYTNETIITAVKNSKTGPWSYENVQIRAETENSAKIIWFKALGVNTFVDDRYLDDSIRKKLVE